ncbi:hypothetical protein [Planomonospora sp. ID82291]|uniref:hypothetical protein n=1 Tax=Planomonospora sp. ID82291 TaxID=2738136 RepID=UPI0018C39B42|nr:hypothetical protein [Planomonospora sp. ID82291]MBG0819012.1 hypothetical protein [Planomonospora sp. ID82291]
MSDLSFTTDDMTGDQVARLGLANAAAATVDRLLHLVSTVDDARRAPGDLLREALDALRTMNKVVARAVTTESLRGTRDEELADVFDMDEFTFVRRYGHFNANHLADDPRGMWAMLRPTCPAPINDTCPDDPAEAAHVLDAWMRRHLDPREAAPAPAHPVSAGL